MSLKEFVAHEVETLDESELRAVAEYVSFLKFRARASLSETRLAELYGDFRQEDRELAEAGLEEYADALARVNSALN